MTTTRRTHRNFTHAAEPVIAGDSVKKCLLSGGLYPKEMMIRFVLGPHNILTPDLEGKLGAHGFWVNARKDIIEGTVKTKKWFTKAARHDVVIPEDLLGRLDFLLVQRCKNLLSLLKKSGKLVTGFEKVHQALIEKKSGTLLFASDGAEGSLAKLGHLDGIKVCRDFMAREQEEALGVSPCIFIALFPCRLEKALTDELLRLRLFRYGSIE